MKKMFFKVIGFSFALALVLNFGYNLFSITEDPPLHGANTITQLHIS